MQNENEKKTNSGHLALKIFYAKGIRVSIKNRTFKEAMYLIWQSPAFSDYEPLKIVFTSTGKTLYADKQAFLHYLDGNFNLEALVQHTQCDELYRNKEDFKADSFDFIAESGSLWKLKNNSLTLIDDDNYVETVLSSFFEIAE
ncbi:hypothetical protein ACMDB5_13245 [Flavobacterium sp. W1B]|uniref:hypothetical protein n=1 Tax=Flavobacterium sp. W1B TaxID=3394146 RepID=UPI0039BCBFCF